MSEYPIMTISESENIFEENEKIILSSSGKASAIAALPVPLIDIPLVTYIQINMINKLASNYGIQSDQKIRATLTTLFTVFGSNFVAELVELMTERVGLNKVVGKSLVKASLHGILTTVIGKAYDKHFKNGGNFEDLELSSLYGFIKKQFSEELSNFIKLSV